MASRYGDDILTAPVTAARAASPRALSLSVIAGSELATHPLPAAGRIVIGRSPQSDIHIDDPSLSRSHAALHVGTALQIEDLGSSNGTRVEGRSIAPGALQPVAPGEVIELGGVSVVILATARAPERRPRRILSHDYFEARLEDECARAARTQSPLAVLRLGVGSGVAEAALHEALAELLGAEHVVATYGPGEYEALLVGAGPDEAARLAAAIAARLERGGAPVRHAIACCPRDGRSPELLMAQACQLVRAPRRAPPPPAERPEAASVVVHDPAMIRLHQLIARVAPGTISVLLLGETGTGKEVLAEAVHHASPRRDRPLLRLNCAALSETLLESELFGHEKGAFSGAVQAKAGLLETASGGSVFLDELGDMPLSLQAKLLRVLEDRKVTRVGGLKAKPIDVRFISATNHDLEAAIARGQFRADLYYRLNGISLLIPPLRERVSELEALAELFIGRVSSEIGCPRPRLSPPALALLQRYVWPGNIRELRNVIERAVLLCAGDEIGLDHLPVEKMNSEFAVAPVEPHGELAAGDERSRIVAALERCAGNQTQAARLLGISRGTLVSRIAEYAIPRPRKR